MNDSPSTRREELRSLDKSHLWHPFTPQADWLRSDTDPLIIERAEGCELIDIDGNRYLDGVGSLWCNVLGHRHPKLDAAIVGQLGKVAHTTLLGLSHPPAIELASRLARVAPPGLTRVFFSDNGATAVEVALKMAYQYWRQRTNPEPSRTRFVALGGAYHGDTLGDVSLGGVDRFHELFKPLLFPVLRAPIPHCYRCPLGLRRPECETSCLNELDHILGAYPGEVVAVVIEPMVQGAAGIVVHPPGYLRGVREITRRHGVLLIADEVATGFGKTGRMFACEHEGVSPDFLCLAKGLTGGYLPLAATLTTEEVFMAFHGTASQSLTFQHGHTFGGNPLGAAVSIATLDVLEEEGTIAALGPRLALLARLIDRLGEHPHVGEARHLGFMVGIELVADKETRAEYPWHRQVGREVCRLAREHGVLIRPLGDVVVLMPPLTISEDQLRRLLDVVEECLNRVTGS